MTRRNFLDLLVSPLRLVQAMLEPQPEPEDKRDVHTEHCCLIHGCKYAYEDCTVVSEEKVQSYPCEWCDDEEWQ